MLVVVLLVEFVIEGDLYIKDATCQVDSKSQNLIWPNITQSDLILLNIAQGPVATLTIFPSVLICLIRLTGRSDGSSRGISICPVVPVTTSRGAGRRTSCVLILTARALMWLPVPRPRLRASLSCPRAPAARPGSRSSD